jgi:1,4-alpha-glucan branching enzyme
MNVYNLDSWNRTELPFTKLDFGKWSLTLSPNPDGSPRIKHLSEIKVSKSIGLSESHLFKYSYFINLITIGVQVVVKDKHGNLLDRISPWAKYVVQPPEHEGYTYKYIFYNPQTV